MAQLTEDQIRQIHVYVRNRGIETIDLEHELVDHLACTVEEKMDASGDNFYDAFKKVMLSYGPFGLHDVQRRHNRMLRKKGWRMYFRTIGSWAKSTAVLIIVPVWLVCYWLVSFYLDFFLSNRLIEAAYLVMFPIAYALRFTFPSSTRSVQQESIYQVSLIPLWFIYFSVILARMMMDVLNHFTSSEAFSVFITTGFTIGFIAFWLLMKTNRKLYEELSEKYGRV